MSESTLFQHHYHMSSNQVHHALHAESDERKNHASHSSSTDNSVNVHDTRHLPSSHLQHLDRAAGRFLHIAPIQTLLENKNVGSIQHLKSSESIAQLLKERIFKSKNVKDDSLAEAHIQGKKRSVPVQKISIVYSSETNHKEAQKASFQITKQGEINVLSNPDKHNNKTLIISLERSPGDLSKPSHLEQAALTKLVEYLSMHFSHKDAAQKPVRPQVEDKWSVLDAHEKSRINESIKPEDRLSTHAKQAVERIYRFTGAGEGHLSSNQLNSYFPEGKARGNDTTRVRKDVIAGMASDHEPHPYTAVGTAGEGKIGVGRYMLTYDLLNTWLELNPSKATEFENRPSFELLMQELKKNEQPSSTLIEQALPASTQETMSNDLMNYFESKMGLSSDSADTAKLALAFYLGHIPDANDLQNTANICFMNSAKQLTALSAARVANPDQDFDFQAETDTSGCSTLALKLAASVQRESSGSTAHGACSHYVRLAFDKVDASFNGLFAGTAKDAHLADDPRLKEICNSLSELSHIKLQPGDTIQYGPKRGTDSPGHIETMGLDHLMHSDFSHKLTLAFASGYQWLKVFRPTSSA